MGSLDNVRKPPHSKTFGLELECYPPSSWRAAFTSGWEEYRHHGFWYCDSDGSLSSGGREFIAQPMPYNMMIKQIKWLHKYLESWRVDHKCGLHIHVSRQYWSSKREQAFSEFLKTTNRTQREELFGRDSTYASPFNPSYEKYRAVNLLHSATYEFRLWAAGDLNWTLEALRRTKLIVEYKGKWSYEKCLELFTKPEGRS